MAAAPEPDDFAIPPPSDNATAEPPDFNAVDNGFATMPDPPLETGVGQTELILGIAGILVLAGLLLFLRNAIRRSLIANRATIDSANAAAWTWYFALLLAGAMVIAGVIGGLFGETSYIMITVGVVAVGLIFALIMHNKARRSA